MLEPTNDDEAVSSFNLNLDLVNNNDGNLARCQFHQHLYVRIFCTNVVLAAFSSYALALAKKFIQKNVDEIDGRLQN